MKVQACFNLAFFNLIQLALIPCQDLILLTLVVGVCCRVDVKIYVCAVRLVFELSGQELSKAVKSRVRKKSYKFSDYCKIFLTDMLLRNTKFVKCVFFSLSAEVSFGESNLTFPTIIGVELHMNI